LIVPEKCGHKELDSKGTSASPTIFAYFPYLVSMWYDVKWQKYGPHYQDVTTWWNFPEPIFNTFYYGKETTLIFRRTQMQNISIFQDHKLSIPVTY
jgi:hypothetical protein